MSARDRTTRSPQPRAVDRGRGETSTARIVERVRAIPRGFVRTYGDIDPHAPRLVGHVLAAIHDLPWHRVVRADGRLPKGAEQRERLLREGVPMRGERVDLREARLPTGADPAQRKRESR
jgi:methylated-DNA-protein-cysteine methyltransferase-like protein